MEVQEYWVEGYYDEQGNWYDGYYNYNSIWHDATVWVHNSSIGSANPEDGKINVTGGDGAASLSPVGGGSFSVGVTGTASLERPR